MEKKESLRCPLCGQRVSEEPRQSANEVAKMRKEFARQLRAKGYSLRQICRIVGWKSPRTAALMVREKQKMEQSHD